jgi:hypothetical protein
MMGFKAFAFPSKRKSVVNHLVKKMSFVVINVMFFHVFEHIQIKKIELNVKIVDY